MNGVFALAKKYTGSDINVYFEPKRCVHATECVRGLSHVFDVNQRPWINPDNDTAEHIAEVVERCPSGALTYELASNEVESHDETRVTYGDNGEIFLYGDFSLVKDGEVMHLNRAILTTDETKTDDPPFYTKSFQGQSDKSRYYKSIQDDNEK